MITPWRKCVESGPDSEMSRREERRVYPACGGIGAELVVE